MPCTTENPTPQKPQTSAPKPDTQRRDLKHAPGTPQDHPPETTPKREKKTKKKLRQKRQRRGESPKKVEKEEEENREEEGPQRRGKERKIQQRRKGRRRKEMLFSFKNKYNYTYLNTYIALYSHTPKLPVTHTHPQKQEIVVHPS